MPYHFASFCLYDTYPCARKEIIGLHTWGMGLGHEETTWILLPSGIKKQSLKPRSGLLFKNQVTTVDTINPA